ncbi:MAG: pilus assembly FimT family protein [bacterium]
MDCSITRTTHQQGFTLIELMLVLVIVSLVMVMVGAGMTRGLQGAKIRNAAKDIAAAMRTVRGVAIRKRKQQSIEIDAGKHQVLVSGKKPIIIPEKLEITLLTAESELTGEQSGRIRFFPDGASTGGQVKLAIGQREWVIHVAWLTGQISIKKSDDR